MTQGHLDVPNMPIEEAINDAEAWTDSSSSVTSKEAQYLRWSRLDKSVQIVENNSGLLRGSIAAPTPKSKCAFKKTGTITKSILSQVSGCAAPGEVLAMMGPSGSGKTTLLNSLSGRTSFDSGVISVNGKSINDDVQAMKRFKSQVAYVKQADTFFTYLTVRDQLGYTAFLRLPQEWSKIKKLDEVERIIKLLRLSKVADSPIMMLSGGEKKRVNIGTELLTDPSVVLLDEPTSGLDSTSAVSLMKMLHKLAKSENKTVISSIHQPNSALFRSFDKLIMLAEGNVVYFGSPVASLDYLTKVGMTCPDGYNAADHWMDLLVSDTAIEEEIELFESTRDLTGKTASTNADEKDVESSNFIVPKRGRRPVTSRQQLIDAWDSEAIAEEMDVETKENAEAISVAASGTSEMLDDKTFKKYNTTWWYQYRVLVHRAMKNSRSAIFTPINLTKSGLLGLVCGLAWFQLDYTESTVYDINAYFFFTMSYWVFDSMFNALMSFPSERAVILKERSSGSYHLGAYFFAKTSSEMPTRLILPFLYMVISFWLAGISSRFDHFFFTTCITLLSVACGESLGLLVGASVYDMEKAMAMMTVVALLLMLLGGFFVQDPPAWIAWGKYLSPFKYSFDASRQITFYRDVPCDGSGAFDEFCSGDNDFVAVDDVLESIGVHGSVTFNVLMLIVITLVPRFISYYALRAKKEGDR